MTHLKTVRNFMVLGVGSLALMTLPVWACAEGAHDGGPHKGGAMFEKHDLNGDGTISKDEFLKGAEERFSKMDANGDGSITQDEAKAAHEAMREKMKEHREMRREKRSGGDTPAAE